VNIGARTLVALALAGRDQQWLALRSRLGPGTIDRLVNAPRSAPSPRTLQRVASVLGVSAAWLAADVPQREPTPGEWEELRRCVRALRRLGGGARIDARAEPNVRRARGRRVPRAFAGLGAREVYRVRGRSMAGFGLMDGDVVYVKPLTPERLRGAVGRVILFQLNGALYLKQLTVGTHNAVALRSAHAGYEPITLRPGDQWIPLGQAVASMRELVRPVLTFHD
jgi:transcriptional regulator with XRE-family HTH domain